MQETVSFVKTKTRLFKPTPENSPPGRRRAPAPLFLRNGELDDDDDDADDATRPDSRPEEDEEEAAAIIPQVPPWQRRSRGFNMHEPREMGFNVGSNT
jgi:hypothetical protein